MKLVNAFLISIVLAAPVLAQERIFLPKAEVEKLATGKKWVHLRTHDQRKFLWDLRSGGDLWAHGFIGSGRDSGQWSVNEQGQLCVKWRGRSIDRCVAVVKQGEKLLMVDSANLEGVYAELTIE